MKVLLFFNGGSKNRGSEVIIWTAMKLLRDNFKIKKRVSAFRDLDYGEDLRNKFLENLINQKLHFIIKFRNFTN